MFDQNPMRRNFLPVAIFRPIRKTILAVLIGLMGGGVAVLAQQTADAAPAPAIAAAPVAAAVAPAQPVASADLTATVPTASTPTPAAVTPPAPAVSAPAAPAAQRAATPRPPAKPAPKKGKQVYTGPTTIVVLPPTPLLDNEGKQRIDPDGNPMFNPPIKQIRDNKGHPVFDANGKPIFETATNLGYDEKGKKIPIKKVKPHKMTPVSIASGTLTVDGWTGKARLNYDISDLKFLYIYAPAIGTTIISNGPFPGAKEQPGAFRDQTLRVTVDGHPIELWSDKSLLGKKPRPAWVMVDRGFMLPAKFPVFGYGTALKSPYVWPGAKNAIAKGASAPPPLPTDLRPTLQLSACPAGMMRMPAPPVLPGEKAPDQPCVPISTPSIAAATAAPAAPPVATAP